MGEGGRLREGPGCGLSSGCVGLISRSSVLAGREGECRYLFNLVCARPFGLGPCNYIGCTDWPNSLVCSSRKGRTPFSACVSSARHPIEAQYTIGAMFVAFLFVVFSGTIATIWRGWPQLMASWRWWPHGRAAQYDWGNVGSISVRSFLGYSFDQLAWVARIDCQLALVAPWPSNGPRVIN